MSEVPVDSSAYDEQWIACAWGEGGNDDILSTGPILPRPRVARAIALAGPVSDLAVLDIACGRGEVPAIFAQAGAHAVGLDYADAPLQFAGKVRAVHAPDAPGSIELTRADAGRLPFGDDSFDRVTMLDIIEHLYPEQLLKMFCEVRRVLRPGGYAVIHTLPNRWVYDISFRLAHRLLKRIPADPRGPFEHEIHVNEQDLPALHRTLEAAGLQHRIWLEQQIPAQARWNAGRDRYGDQRDRVYARTGGWMGYVLEAVSITPLKLLLCNDIFGILWKDPVPTALPAMPLALTERLVTRLAE